MAELREALLLPTVDLLAVTREFINPAVSRAGLGRCLRRHGVSDLRDLVEQESGAPATRQQFEYLQKKATEQRQSDRQAAEARIATLERELGAARGYLGEHREAIGVLSGDKARLEYTPAQQARSASSALFA